MQTGAGFLEQCDDGNRVSGDGCSSTCQIEAGYECTGSVGSISTCQLSCGDGVLQTSLGEICDDGNHVNGDGCSSTCQVEATY